MIDLINCGFNLGWVLNICIIKKQYHISMNKFSKYYADSKEYDTHTHQHNINITTYYTHTTYTIKHIE